MRCRMGSVCGAWGVRTLLATGQVDVMGSRKGVSETREAADEVNEDE
jgi:hypothetical protein